MIKKLAHKIADFITFTDLPIRRKFLLFSAGTLFWLIFTSLIGFISIYLVNQKSNDVLYGIAPQQDSISAVIRKIRGASITAHKMFITNDNEDLYELYSIGKLRLKDTYNILTTLLSGGIIRDELRVIEQTIDEYNVLPMQDNESRKQIKEILIKINILMSDMDKLYSVLKSKKERLEASNILEDYDRVTKETVTELTFLMTHNKKLWQKKQEEIETIFNNSILFITVVLLMGISLSIIFGYLIAKNLVKPIDNIIERFRIFYEKGFSSEISQIPKDKDEIVYLSVEFRNLLDAIEDMSSFKRLIEEDESVEDIYNRIASTLSEKLGMEKIIIYEISTVSNSIKIAHNSIKDNVSYCSEFILTDCDICKAKRTGRLISSVENRFICKYFGHVDSKLHSCFPVMVAGKVGLVIMWIIDKSLSPELITKKNKKALDYISTAQPVLQGKRFLRALKDASVKDALTNLYNRRFLEESSDSIIAGIRRRGTIMGLLMCDLDFFKETNDKYGHDVGDMVLKETAEIIKSTVRGADYVIRFGGEEFLVLLIDISKDSAYEIAEKIRKRIENTEMNVKGVIIQKTISIGVSEFPSDTRNLWEAIKFADVSLYKAKESGRNKVMRFHPDMWQSSSY